MTSQCQRSKDNKFDLEERTAVFGESVISLARRVQKDPVSRPLVSQLVRSATSVGANYMEADGAESRRDFFHKIALCKKEAKETRHWLRMLAKANTSEIESCRVLWQEAKELSLIFSSIVKKRKNI